MDSNSVKFGISAFLLGTIKMELIDFALPMYRSKIFTWYQDNDDDDIGSDNNNNNTNHNNL